MTAEQKGMAKGGRASPWFSQGGKIDETKATGSQIRSILGCIAAFEKSARECDSARLLACRTR